MKPTLRSVFSGAPGVGESLGRGFQRKELTDRRKRRGGADRFQERAPRRILRKHRAQHGRCNDALVALLFACRDRPGFARWPLDRAQPDRRAGRSCSRPASGSCSRRMGCQIWSWSMLSMRADRCMLCIFHAGRGPGVQLPQPRLSRAIRGAAIAATLFATPRLPLSTACWSREDPPRSAAPDRATIRSRSRSRGSRP